MWIVAPSSVKTCVVVCVLKLRRQLRGRVSRDPQVYETIIQPPDDPDRKNLTYNSVMLFQILRM